MKTFTDGNEFLLDSSMSWSFNFDHDGNINMGFEFDEIETMNGEQGIDEYDSVKSIQTPVVDQIAISSQNEDAKWRMENGKHTAE